MTGGTTKGRLAVLGISMILLAAVFQALSLSLDIAAEAENARRAWTYPEPDSMPQSWRGPGRH